MAIIEAEGRHPDPTDGAMSRFSIWNQPTVRVGEIYGQAIGYTRSFGLIAWLDDNKRHHLEWFPAAQIQRVDSEDWKGNGPTR